MLQLPRRTGESRRCVYGKSREEVERKWLEATGQGAVRVRPGSISEFVVLHFTPWISSRVQSKSFARYDIIWRKQLGPYFGHRLFSELDPEYIQTNLLHAQSGSTQQNAKSLLFQIVTLAVAYGQADPKLATMVRLARVDTRNRKTRVDVADKAAAMLERARGSYMEGPIWAAMTLGLRLAEVCGLMPSDIDLRSKKLTIARQRTDEGVKNRLKSKDKSQVRSFGVPTEMLEQLLAFYRPGTIFLFTREDLTPISYEHPERALAPFQDEDHRLTFHDLRAAAVSTLIDAGVDDHTIMDITGHTSIAMIQRYRDERSQRSEQAFGRLGNQSTPVQ